MINNQLILVKLSRKINELGLYFLKKIIKYIIESLIPIIYITKIIIKLIRIIPIKSELKTEKKKKFNLYIFKSGTMGDHLICLSVINYLRSISYKINATIIFD